MCWFVFITLFWLAPIGDYWFILTLGNQNCAKLSVKYRIIWGLMLFINNSYVFSIISSFVFLMIRFCRRRRNDIQVTRLVENITENLYNTNLDEQGVVSMVENETFMNYPIIQKEIAILQDKYSFNCDEGFLIKLYSQNQCEN